MDNLTKKDVIRGLAAAAIITVIIVLMYKYRKNKGGDAQQQMAGKEGLKGRKKQPMKIPAPDSQAAAAAMIRDLSRIHFLCPVGKTALVHDTGEWQCV